MRLKILIGLAVVIGLFLFVVAMQPFTFSVTRSATLAVAPATSTVFPYVNEPRKWEAWNPWDKLDSAMKLTHEGPNCNWRRLRKG